MTPLTEDELARLETLASAQRWPADGLAEWDYYDHAVVSSAYAEFVRAVSPNVVLSLIAALRASPIADTAGIDAGEKAAREFVESISGPLDLAWTEAEAALPEGGFFMVTRSVPGRYMAHWRDESKDQWDDADEYTTGNPTEKYGHGPTPAAALLALAAALRTPKPEGEPE